MPAITQLSMMCALLNQPSRMYQNSTIDLKHFLFHDLSFFTQILAAGIIAYLDETGNDLKVTV